MEDPDDNIDSRFTKLPTGTRLEDTVATIDTRRTPEPDDVRNVEHHAATRED